jgi:hypothetical protein
MEVSHAVVELAFQLRSYQQLTVGSDMDIVTARGLGTLVNRHHALLSAAPVLTEAAVLPRISNMFQHLMPFMGAAPLLAALTVSGTIWHTAVAA